MDDRKDVVEAAGEPILDAHGMREVDGRRGQVEGAKDTPEARVSMSSMTDNERRKGSLGDGPDASEGWRRRAAGN